MRFTVITVTHNSAATIVRAMQAVRDQAGVEVEHIVKDAHSTDETVALARQVNPAARIVVSRDEGIYDAMNQGLCLATGDFVGFLNSDDYYSDGQVLLDVGNQFLATGCDYVYGDIDMVNAAGKVVREWRVGHIGKTNSRPRQIPHSAYFVRRSVLEQLDPPFDSSYRISADLKQQLIIAHKLGANGCYLARTITVMQLGGASTQSLQSYLVGWRESRRAYNEVFGSGGAAFVVRKVISKIKGLRPWR